MTASWAPKVGCVTSHLCLVGVSLGIRARSDSRHRRQEFGSVADVGPGGGDEGGTKIACPGNPKHHLEVAWVEGQTASQRQSTSVCMYLVHTELLDSTSGSGRPVSDVSHTKRDAPDRL